MEKNLEKHLVDLLNKLIVEVEGGSSELDSLLVKGRFSYVRIFNTRYWQDDVNKVSRSSMLSCPSTYSLFRKLKFLIEQRDIPKLDMDEFREIYMHEISAFHQLPKKPITTTELRNESSALYIQLCSTPDWPRLKYLLLPNSNPDFLYWTDQDLIHEARKYINLTQLKMKGGELHRHIIARELQEKVLSTYPSYNTDTYIGLKGYRYRSQGELILGNMIVLANKESHFLWQVNTNLYRQNSKKPMTADFYCKPIDLYIEISMFVENGRGSRGIFYSARREGKSKIYKQAGLNVLFIDASEFYYHGRIDPTLFANHIAGAINQHNYDGLKNTLSCAPSKIAFFESVKSRLDLNCEDYCEFLAVEYGLTHMSQLSNNKSYLLAAIGIRPDSSEVLAILKAQGVEVRRKALRINVQNREYAAIDIAREFAAKHQLVSQHQWAKFAKDNRELLTKENIPANVKFVYSRLGEWVSWTHFFELARK